MASYTDITILLDRSGSMASIKTAMESGFKEFITEHKENPSTRLSLIQFDSSNDQDVVYSARPITDVPELSLRPRGWTPLLDAACKAIDSTGRRLAAMPASERPDKVLFVIITDGQENSSATFKRADVKRRIEHQSSNYSWQFVYLGANQDAYQEAATLGINYDWALNYAANAEGTRGAFRSLTKNSVNYAVGSAMPAFTTEQQDEAMDKGDKQ